jgi:hypothetical protein
MGMKKPLTVSTYTQIKNYRHIRPNATADKSEYKGEITDTWNQWFVSNCLCETYFYDFTQRKQSWDYICLCRIWGFHGSDYEECHLLGCGAV